MVERKGIGPDPEIEEITNEELASWPSDVKAQAKADYEHLVPEESLDIDVAEW